MAKGEQTRFDETLKWLKSKGFGFGGLADHIKTLASMKSKEIGGQLALGFRWETRLNKDYETNTSQRQALRSLLLCQRVYFSSLWSRYLASAMDGKENKGKETPMDAWPADSPTWELTRTKSLQYWRDKPEQSILDGIRLFTTTSNNPEDLADTAADKSALGLDKPDLPPLPILSLTQKTHPFPTSKFCYPAVRYWMFRSGLVSYRWMMKYPGDLDMFSIDKVFGKPVKVIWPAEKKFTEKDKLPIVPKGWIVHLYVDTDAQRLGHWLVSNGDGMAYGRNNWEEPDLGCREKDRKYDLCNLSNQFLAYKGQKVLQGESKPRPNAPIEPGIAEVFDPREVPNRI